MAEALRQALREAVPWTRYLPPDDIDTLVSELIDTASGAVALDNFAPIALLLTQWRHSAEVYADPDPPRHSHPARLRATSGRVPAPMVAE